MYDHAFRSGATRYIQDTIVRQTILTERKKINLNYSLH